jgi:hypothetical protein
VLVGHSGEILLKVAPKWGGLAPPHTTLPTGASPEETAQAVIGELECFKEHDFHQDFRFSHEFTWLTNGILLFVVDVDRPVYLRSKNHDGLLWMRDSVTLDGCEGIAPVTCALLNEVREVEKKRLVEQDPPEIQYFKSTELSYPNTTMRPLTKFAAGRSKA